MSDISYIKWNTFSVNSDVSLQTLHDYIDGDTTLKTHLATTSYSLDNYDISSVDGNYIVWKLKNQWVLDYSDNDPNTHGVEGRLDFQQITSGDSIHPHQGYWIKYKIYEKDNGGTVPSTNFALRNNNGTLELWWGGDKPSGWTNVYLATINMNLNTSFNFGESIPAGSTFSDYAKDNLYVDGTDKSNFIQGPLLLAELQANTWMPFLTDGGITTSSQFLDNPSGAYATDVIICNNQTQSSGILLTATIDGSNPLDLSIN